jgi:2-dehydropantoate 2-reductase
MRILIYGAGAVGSFIGGHLALAGHDVTLLGRARLAEAVSSSGLVVRQADGSERVVSQQIRATSSLPDALLGAPYDWIAFTMKAYDTVEAISELQSLIPEPPPIVSFQNGIGNEESLRSAFGAEKIVAGTLTTPVSMPDARTVIEEKRRGVAISIDAPSAAPITDALSQTSLTLSTVDRADSLKWSKLLLNIVGNVVPAILDLPPAAVFGNPALFNIEWMALREAVKIIDLNSIPLANLPGAPARTLAQAVRSVPKALLQLLLAQQVRRGRGNKPPSLLAALRAGARRTEIAWLNGAVVKAADSVHQLAPVNHALALILSDITTGRATWEMYRRSPDLLITSIRLVETP